jgi:hypothetical protein
MRVSVFKQRFENTFLVLEPKIAPAYDRLAADADRSPVFPSRSGPG